MDVPAFQCSRTLTNLSNARPTWVANAHAAPDQDYGHAPAPTVPPCTL